MYCSPSTPIQTPTSVPQLQALVTSAISSGLKVKAIGSRHSLTDVICTPGMPISMLGINYTILGNGGTTVTFGAGIEMIDALTFLENNGLSLIHVPAFGGITIGGAIGTGARKKKS
jgi:FAD/FMN-containing dehydrogenase